MNQYSRIVLLALSCLAFSLGGCDCQGDPSPEPPTPEPLVEQEEEPVGEEAGEEGSAEADVRGEVEAAQSTLAHAGALASANADVEAADAASVVAVPAAPPAPTEPAARRAEAGDRVAVAPTEPEPAEESEEEIDPTSPASALRDRRPIGGPAVALGPNDIERMLAIRGSDLRRCYERLLPQAPETQGRVNLQLDIGADGSIAAVRLLENELGDQAGSCISGAANRWSFIGVTEAVTVEKAYRFEPGG